MLMVTADDGTDGLPGSSSAMIIGKGSNGVKNAATAQRNAERLYRVWPSRNTFFCCGALMMGGEKECQITAYPCRWSGANLCSWSFIAVPSIVYFIFGAYHCSEGKFPVPLYMVTGLVFLLTISCLLLACCSDPGVIPRRATIIAADLEKDLTAVLGYNPLGEGNPVHQLEVDSRTMVPADLSRKGYRWCHTCEIVRPPRASHCPECDNCVLRFDHHCPFVNNCVGQRNYPFFFSFTSSVCVLAILVLPSLAYFYLGASEDRRGGSGTDLTQTDVISYMLIAVCCLAGLAALALGTLWGYHVFLISQGKTTKEHLKGRKQMQGVESEPVLCAPRGPQLFDQFALVDLEKLISEPSSSGAGKTSGSRCCQLP